MYKVSLVMKDGYSFVYFDVAEIEVFLDEGESYKLSENALRQFLKDITQLG